MTERANAALNQILNLLRDLDLIIVLDYLLVCLPWIHGVCNLVRELEPTFLLLLEDVRAYHEVLGGCPDCGQLLITYALGCL